jgi:Fe-S-cluster-containing dehydrogenase component/CRP-like cAMP-binding protein
MRILRHENPKSIRVFMPQEHTSRREVINAVKGIDSIADLLSQHEGHYNYELDLEVNVYGRNYNGKKVGPYLRLFTYNPGEAIITEGDWGGNTFYIVVEGLADVFVNTAGGLIKVAEKKAGDQFGEMSVLAGVPRNATVKAPPASTVKILEVQRPALRLLRKLPKFGDNLDKTYRTNGRNVTADELKEIAALDSEMLQELKNISLFKVFSKNHVLFREKAPIDRLYIVKEGWVRRSQEGAKGEVEDFVGHGNCFGTDGVMKDTFWPYTATVMGRTEVLEVSVTKLRQNPRLRQALLSALERYTLRPFEGEAAHDQPNDVFMFRLLRGEPKDSIVRKKTRSAQAALIDTGLVDGTNLLVMDMDLCVRCGNCSLACHHVHGQSRLTRRGVHVVRLQKPTPSALQSILSPSVCMHCKDPECLTGCPTGAIGRFGMGEVDIEPRTCIGCGDCASQCPYNAISLVPRKPAPVAATNGGWAGKIKNILRLSPDPLPPEIQTTEDLVAVKCNLCNHTTMNPRDKSDKPLYAKQAYSCEENCPTGALARVNPKQYFEEVGEIEGLLLVDQKHAIGRNIHKNDPPRRLSHIIGIALTVVLTAATIIGLQRYGLGERLMSFLNMRWITGLVGLVGIAIVMTYPWRRQYYRVRKGPLRYWLLSHTYAGVIAGLMILFHGGTDAGGVLTTMLMISWDIVIATGIFGILVYLIAPRILTKIEGSPLLIDDLKTRREELQKELADLGSTPTEPLRSLVRDRIIPKYLSFGFLMRQYTGRENLDAILEEAKREFKVTDDNRAADAGLPDEKQKRRVARAVEAAVTMRRIDALIYLHRMLKVWLPPHVISTSLMLALMIIHIIQVIYYAAR